MLLPPLKSIVGSLQDWPETAKTAQPATALSKPDPADWVCIVTKLGVIEFVGDPCTVQQANDYRQKIIEANDGECNVTVVRKEVAKLLGIGMRHQAILDALELHAARSRPT